MSAPVSVIVPTWRAADGIGPCLGALAEGAVAGLVRELILSDGGSDDGIDRVADAAGARLIVGPRGRGGQLRRGAEAARGAWLLFVHADTVLGPGWVEAVRRHMAAAPEAAGWFRLAFDDPSGWARWTAGWANLRSARFGRPFGDQGLLVPARLYREVGGHPDWPLMEDVEIARRLRGRLRGLEAAAVTSAAKYRAEGWLRVGARNLWRQARFAAGASPERLAGRPDARR